MIRNLPLATLRTFDVAARHQSLTKAASELGLTDSAISHQLRRLEEALGVELFAKAGRGVTLTNAGRIFAGTVSEALQSIARTAHRLSDSNNVGGRLLLSCSPTFASKWLSRNLPDFCHDHPTIECHIKLSENERLVAEAVGVDVRILFGAGAWPGKWSALLENVSIAPACSPVLFQRVGQAISRPVDLRDVVLLHQDDGSEWRRWLAAEGEHDFDLFTRHLFCSDLSVAIDLAIEGAGIVLVSDTLSNSYIEEGALLRPFSHSIQAAGGWYVVCDSDVVERANTRLFLHWLMARFGKMISFNAGDQGPLFDLENP